MRPLCRVLPLLLPFALIGCGPEQASSPEEPLEDEVIADGSEEGKADSYGSTSIYILASPDYRKCMFPLCGGFFLRRANRTTIKCGDGKYAPTCYVADVDLAKLKLGLVAEDPIRSGLAEERAVLRGTIAKTKIAGYSVDRLIAREAWLAPAAGLPAAGDELYRGSPSGIVCVKAPCPTVHVAKLNSTIAANIVEPSLDSMPGSKQEHLDAAFDLTHRALILAGHPDQASLAVSQGYRRVLPTP